MPLVSRWVSFVLLLFVLAACSSPPPPNVTVTAQAVTVVETRALPTEPIALTGVVQRERPSSSPYSVLWVQTSGPAAAAIADPSLAATQVVFPAEGAYTFRFNVYEGSHSYAATVSIKVLLNGRRAVAALGQSRYVATGFEPDGTARAVPSPDPAGIGFHAPSGRLFLADSEIEEEPVFERVGANLFQIALDGNALDRSWDLTVPTAGEPKNTEPTGIAFCGDHVFVSNDNRGLIYAYRFDGEGFAVAGLTSTKPFTTDPEDLACDPEAERLYVVGGSNVKVLVYSYDADGLLTLLHVLDLVETAGDLQGVPSDPEGIAFDPVSRRLFLVSDPDMAIFEFETSGIFVRRYDLSGLLPKPLAPQGLTFGPSSDGSKTSAIYIADGGRDNNQYPDEFEGAIYELRVTRAD